MVAALLVMLLVGFAMGVTVTEILISRPARKDANDNLRLAQRATATATNWERIAEKTMEQAYRPVDADNRDHSKAAELRVVTS
jgi:hypothetical protein